MSISDIANLAVALTSIVAIFLGINRHKAQNTQARQLVGIQILRDFEDKFYRSEHLRQLRYFVCVYYKRHGVDAETPPEAWRLADELAAICFYVNKGYVDAEAAWSTLYFWLDNYWFLFKGYADGLKTEYAGVDYLSDFREVHATLTRFGEAHRNLPAAQVRHDSKAIAQFLDDEIVETSDSRRGSGHR